MAVPYYLDLIMLLALNFSLSLVTGGIPHRRNRDQDEELVRLIPNGPYVRILWVTGVSILLWLAFIFVTVPLLYQVLTDFVLIGFSTSLPRSMRTESGRRKALALVAIFLVVGVFSVGYYAFYAQVNDAYYFNSLLSFQPGSQLFSNSSLQIEKLPLVSQDYASSIASSHLSDFGGSVQLVDSEQIVHRGQPYWIFTVSPTNTFAENHELGFILVNAVNGSYYEVQSTNTVGPGLFLTSAIDFHSFLGDTAIVIGNHYPTPSPSNISAINYVFTQSQVGLDGVTSFNGGTIYASDGSVAATYGGLASPDYVNQPWDKFLVSSLADQWGSTRSGNGSFSLFAGGFLTIPASQSRLALSADEELIPYENSTALMLFMIPANAPNSLEGVVLAYGSRFTFYDMRGMNLVSPDYAKATVQSKLPALSTGELFAANPVIYPANGKFIWIVPYYYNSGSGIVQFQGIAVMDASNAGNLVIQAAQQTIGQTRDAALASLLGGIEGNGTQPATVTGAVQDFVTYVQNGNTFASIEVDGTYYLASASTLPFNEWVQALQLKVGQNVTLQVQGQTVVGLKT